MFCIVEAISATRERSVAIGNIISPTLDLEARFEHLQPVIVTGHGWTR